MSNITHRFMGTAFIYLSLIVLGILFLIPLAWMVVSSLKPENLIFSGIDSVQMFFPQKASLENYFEVFRRVPFLVYIYNSLLYVSLIVIFGLIVNSLCAYALVKLKFPGSEYILMAIIALYIIPFESVLLPLYLIVNKLGWVNELPALYMPFIAQCFNIFLFRQFFLNFPDELEQAAQIDGASPIQTFLRIVIPNSKPVFATVAILTFVHHWGDFIWPLIVTTDDKIRNIQVGLQFLFTEPPIQYGPILAGLTMTTIPVIIIFVFFQKYYVQGITSSGIKG